MNLNSTSCYQSNLCFWMEHVQFIYFYQSVFRSNTNENQLDIIYNNILEIDQMVNILGLEWLYALQSQYSSLVF